jgi:hypothetical protein
MIIRELEKVGAWESGEEPYGQRALASLFVQSDRGPLGGGVWLAVVTVDRCRARTAAIRCAPVRAAALRRQVVGAWPGACTTALRGCDSLGCRLRPMLN